MEKIEREEAVLIGKLAVAVRVGQNLSPLVEFPVLVTPAAFEQLKRVANDAMAKPNAEARLSRLGAFLHQHEIIPDPSAETAGIFFAAKFTHSIVTAFWQHFEVPPEMADPPG